MTNYECDEQLVSGVTAEAITFSCSVIAETIYTYLLLKMRDKEVVKSIKL